MKSGLFISFLFFIFHVAAFAAPQSLSYQGRILDSSSNPMESSSVVFRFTLLSPDGTCELWTETKSAINMTGSGGIFDLTIGPSAGLATVLENGTNHTCLNSGNYTGIATAGRQLKVEFNPGSTGWREITPNLTVNSVPYASVAAKLGNMTAGDFIARPGTCSTGQSVYFDGTNFVCQALVAGDIPDIDAAKITTGTLTRDVLTTNVSATNGQFTNLRIYDGVGQFITMNYPSAGATSYTIRWPAVQGAASTVLQNDGAGNLSWAAAGGGSGDITEVTAGTGLTGGATTGAATLAVDAGLGANRVPMVGGIALGANGVVVANGMGTALTSLNCTIGQVIKFDISGFATCGADSDSGSGSFSNGGNTFGASATIGTNDNFSLSLETNNNPRVTILSNGNVGIGTSNPIRKLDIEISDNLNQGQVIAMFGSTSGGRVAIVDENVSRPAEIVNGNALGLNIGAQNGPLLLSAGDNGSGQSQERMRITSSGNVGIGTTAPGALLQVGNPTSSLGTLRLAGNTSGYVQIQPAAAAGSWNMTLPASDGDPGQVLSTDGSGVTSWVTASGATALDALTDVATDYSTTYNMFLGQGVGASTSGDRNTGLGAQVMQSLTTGVSNTAVGNQALQSVTTGGTNTAVGRESSMNLVNGHANTSVGFYSLANNTSGSVNTAIGDGVLSSLTSGSSNTGVGRQSLQRALDSENTGFGSYSGNNLRNGGGNIYIGHGSGPSTFPTDESSSLYIHNASGNPTIFGDLANRRIGLGGMTNPSTTLDINGAVTMREMVAPTLSPADQGRIYFDSSAKKFRVSENGSTFVDLVGSAGVTGSGTTNFVPLWTSGTALGNSVIQESSGRIGIGGAPDSNFVLNIVGGNARINGLTFGSGLNGNLSSVAVGRNALASTTTGYSNIGIGSEALSSLTTQFENIGIGANAGYQLSSGMNTAIGSLALEQGGGGIGENTVLGARALRVPGGHSGGGNTIIGTSAATNLVSGNDNIIIGRGISAPSATDDFQLNIGNLIYGDMTAASRMVDVNGALNIRGLASAPSLSASDNGKLYYDNTDDRLKVSLNGGAYANVLTNMSGFNANQAIVANGSGVATSFTCGIGQVLGFDASGFATCTSVTGVGGFLNNGNSFAANATLGTNDNFALNFETNNTTRMTILSGGNVGIGDTNPQDPLRVVRSTANTGGVDESGISLYRTFTAADSGPKRGVSSTVDAIHASGNIPQLYGVYSQVGRSGAGTVAFIENFAAGTFIAAGSSVNNLIGYRVGNAAGTGTVSTQYGVRVENLTRGSTNYAIYTDGATNSYFGGNVGIGALSPGAMLQLGTAGTSLGTMRLTGNTSGFVQIQPAAAAGSWNMTLPANDGDPGQVLSTDGSGITSWVSAGGASTLDALTDVATDYSTTYNMFLGQGVGASTSGTRNTGVGAQVMSSLTTGYNNTALGNQALQSLSTGYNNTAVGRETLMSLTTGERNMAIGMYTAANLVNGSDNIVIGDSALGSSISGSDNIAIGSQSLGSSTGSGNTSVGHRAGLNASGVSSSNVFLGFLAGPSSSTTVNNTLWINNWSGNPLIYGDFSSRRVGIGDIVDPSSTLDINGAITQRGMVAPALSPAGQGRIYFDSGSNLFRVSQNGGAYTNLPTNGGTFLSEAGTAGAPGFGFSGDPDTGINNAYSNAIAISAGGSNVAIIDPGGLFVGLSRISNVGLPDPLYPVYAFNADADTGVYNPAANALGFTSSGVERMRISAGGEISIGNTSTAHALNVTGSAGLSTGTAWTNTSDARLKDVHGDYEYGLSEILKLNTVRFNYKKNNPLQLSSEIPMTGFVAQEVQKVIPDAVTVREDGYLELNVDPIHWATVNAVQDLYGMCKASEKQMQAITKSISNIQREIASLKDENKSLKLENEMMKKDLETIKKKLGL